MSGSGGSSEKPDKLAFAPTDVEAPAGQAAPPEDEGEGEDFTTDEDTASMVGGETEPAPRTPASADNKPKEKSNDKPAKDKPARLDRLPRGTVIERYLILDRLGAGGMGVVYEAHDPELNRLVAIKLVRSDSKDPQRQSQSRARMMREAQAMARLSHPNVITVHDIGTYSGQIFVAMEYIEGGTLRDWLGETPRTWQQILDIFTLAGRGLAAAHSAELVHRDFKPETAAAESFHFTAAS